MYWRPKVLVVIVHTCYFFVAPDTFRCCDQDGANISRKPICPLRIASLRNGEGWDEDRLRLTGYLEDCKRKLAQAE